MTLPRRKPTPPTVAAPRRYCDTCKHATFDMQHKNLSLKGEPTLIICDLHPFPKIVVGHRACNSYE